MKTRVFWRVTKVILLLGVALWAAPSDAANPTNGLRIEIMAAYNAVVDSNVESPSTYAPRAGMLGAHFCNDGTNTLTNVWAYIGDYVAGGASTPGVYPRRTHMSLVGFPPDSKFALTHEGGSAGLADASRYIGTIRPGECKMVYWLVGYPNLDANGDAVWGPSIKPDDDLWLEYDIWATAQRAGTPIVADQTRTLTMRNEISAMANKIFPNGANKVPEEFKELLDQYQPSWTNGAYDGSPGTVIVTEGIWYDLGNVGYGFDNDGDLVPDQNAWMQPVGDPALFDPGCFRLVQTRTMLIIKLNTGENLVYTDTDKLYYMGIPGDNRGAVGYVAYDFQVLKGGCGSQLTPYQEVASGYDNEKFNGDYGAFLGFGLTSQTSQLTFVKSASTPFIAPGEAISYNLSFTNAGTVEIGDPSAGVPVTIKEHIPHGTLYIPLSAYSNTVVPAGSTNFTILFSTNNGLSWQNYEPTNAALVTDIQWWLDAKLATGAWGNVSLSVTVQNPYTNAVPFISNTGCVSVGDTEGFICDDTNVTVRGTNQLGDTVWADTGVGGGYLGNGIQDGTEPGITNITVWLYLDSNTNGVRDVGDYYYGSQITTNNGYYMFTNLPDGKFVAVVDMWDPDLPYGYTPTTPIFWAADLDSARTNTNAVVFLTADYGFAPALVMDKQLVGSNVVYENRTVQYTVTVSNTIPGNGTSSGGACQYYAWPTNGATGDGNVNKVWLNFTNTFKPAGQDGLYATAPLNTSAETLDLSNFVVGVQNGSITNVKLVMPMRVDTNVDTKDEINIIVYRVSPAGMIFSNFYFVTNLYAFLTPTASNYQGTASFDLNMTNVFYWSDFATNYSIRLKTTKGLNSDGLLHLDTAGFLLQSDRACGGGSNTTTTLNPVPLEDWFKTNELTFLSAQPSPSAIWTNGTWPNITNTLYWANLGPLYPGGSRTVTLNFRLPESTNNVDSWVTNYAKVTNAWFVSGKPANTATDEVPVTVRPTASVGDFVWRDIDRDGVQDGGDEAGIPNVSIVLIPPTNVDVGAGVGVRVTNLTDSAGYYLFTGIPSTGIYTIVVLTNTLPVPGATNTYDWDGVNNSTTTVFTLNPYTTNANIRYVDFGYYIGSTLEGTVWHDLNRSATTNRDPGEPWITNVTVYLYRTNNLTTPIATNWTDANGYFQFTGNYTGYYFVVVATNLTTMTNANWIQTFDTNGTNTPHTVLVNVPLGGRDRADYSYYKVGNYDLGDRVWYDWNGDGVQDANEEGITNVTVWLYTDINSNGFVDVGTDILYRTTTTTTNGWYLFTQLPSSNYLVVVNQSSPGFPSQYVNTYDAWGAYDGRSLIYLTATNLLQDFGYRPYGYGAIGDRVWYDNDGDGVQDFGELGISNITVSLYVDADSNGTYVLLQTLSTVTNGYYMFTNLPSANYRVTVNAADADLPTNQYGNLSRPTTVTNYNVTITGTNVYRDADFGFVLPGAIGDTIYWDYNRSGEQDGSEPGISGVTVRLYYDLDTNRVYSLGDVLVAETNTDVNGLYIFTSLWASNYVVEVDESSTPLTGAVIMADPNNDGLSCLDTNKNEECDGEYGLYLNFNQSFMGADFGYTPPGAIGDYVWIDSDGDGYQDVGEPVIPYITVSLYSNGTLVATSETGPDGYYGFGNLTDGNYVVIVNTNDTDFPGGLVNTWVYNGTPDSTTTNILIFNGSVTNIGGLYCTNCNLDIDFGYRYTGTNSLSGTIGLDAQVFDGLMNSTNPNGPAVDEVPFANVSVFLYLWDDDGDDVVEAGESTYINSTLTVTNGDYSFTGLPDGDGDDYYIVSMVAPYDYLIMTTTNGSTEALAVSNKVNNSGYTISAFQVYDIEPFITNVDFAFTYGVVYDWGDLPSSYGTLLQDYPMGPKHQVPSTNLYLGDTIDMENNGQPSILANGDGADEDGVWTYEAGWSEGSGGATIYVKVGSGTGWLVGYIDWNTNGVFSESGELVISTNVSDTGGNGLGEYTFDVDVPTNTISTNTNTIVYARFRLMSTQPVFPELAYSGAASDGEVEDYRWVLPFGTTYVLLDRFDVYPENGETIVEWETATEAGTAGFYVSRRERPTAPWVRVMKEMVPALFEAPQGGVYRIRDAGAQAGHSYEYRLEEVEYGGNINPHGPYPVSLAPAQPKARATAARVKTPAIERTPRQIEGATEAEPVVEPVVRRTAAIAKLLKADAEWPAVKLGVASNAIYFVSASSLASALGATEAQVLERIANGTAKLSVQGQPVAYRPAATGFYFYGQAVQSAYAPLNVYWLTWDGGSVMAEQEVSGVSPGALSVFTDALHAEQNKFAATAFFSDPEADYWFWEYLSAGSAQYGTRYLGLVAPGVASVEDSAVLTVRLQGATSSGLDNEHHVQISLNGTLIGEASWTGQTAKDVECIFPQSLLVTGSNTVRLVALLDSGIPQGIVYLNSFDLTYRRTAEAQNGQVAVNAGDTSPVAIGGFGAATPAVLDVRDPLQPSYLTGIAVEGGKAGFEPASAGGIYAAFDPATARTPKTLSVDTPSDWRNAANAARFVVIAPADLSVSAQVLVNRRNTEGLSSVLVLLEDIYDEFNYGLAEPKAIRDFLAYAKSRWATPPDYALLAGEGTYDYKGYTAATDNKIPAAMRPTPHGLFVADGWYADVDEDGVVDLAIGRLPAATSAELTTMINKIVAFESSEGGLWRQQFLLAADNADDAGDFPATADSVSTFPPRDYETAASYLATNNLTAARSALLGKLKTGTAHMVYFGHGGTDRLAAEGLLKSSDVTSITNNARLPVMVFLTCSAGQFPIPGLDCLAETLMLSTKGGASAVWAPSGLSYNDRAKILATAYYEALFLGHASRVGDACLSAYQEYAAAKGAEDFLPHIYNLMGDPTMRFVGTAAINGAPTFSSWSAQFFSNAELSNPAVGYSSADADGDGVINLLEYAFAWNPRKGDGPALGLRRSADRDDPTYLWVFEYQRRKNVNDVEYLVDSASTLPPPAWGNALQGLMQTDVLDDGNGLTETVRLKIRRQDVDQLEKLFLRLRVRK